jgi:hypothetical protein
MELEKKYCAETNSVFWTFYVDGVDARDVRNLGVFDNPEKICCCYVGDVHNTSEFDATITKPFKLFHVYRFTQWNPLRAVWIATCVMKSKERNAISHFIDAYVNSHY